MIPSRIVLTLLVLVPGLAGGTLRAGPRDDILIEDFEGPTYGKWKAQGEAFGKGPARGPLPGQMPVTGFLGKGLVNSFVGGDRSTGTLTSPPIAIQRRYINFLVGGGGHAGKTCVNLLHAGKVVRTATGPNINPGGSERLDWHTWDVGDLAGKIVTIQIVDNHTGGWGHINVDHIVQSDRKKQAGPAHRELVVRDRYLLLPVRTGAPKRRMRLVVAGKIVREFEIELADDKPSFQVAANVAPFQGKFLRIEVTALPPESKALAAIAQADVLEPQDRAYREKDRPQLHFTARRGWLNDPNGLVWYQGEYHLFFQHNPYGWNWGNMHWGHAVSKDLVHWRELPLALYPQRFDDWCFSGSAVVDRDNTSGFKKGKDAPLVLAYTSTGRGECIAFSNDRGRTWTEYAGNPVVKHAGRDPRLLWHAPSKRWVMAVYDEHDRKQWIAFHTSADLKKWQFTSRIEGWFECPDLFELPIEGEPGKKKWVLYAADGKYVVGNFDGKSFHPETARQQVWSGNFYAAQTFSDVPDGRRVQIGWANGIAFPGMPFNQQMALPCQLTLRNTPTGVRMFVYPVKEMTALRGKKHAVNDRLVKPGDNPLEGIKGELLDIDATLQPEGASECGFTLRGLTVLYDVKKQQLRCGAHTLPVKPTAGKLRLRLLVDRGSLELFANDGQIALSVGHRFASTDRSLKFFSKAGNTRLHSLEVFPLRSIWEKPPQ
jgi:fructan beta-fructosidase